jgi:hypothetical protein
MAHAPHAPQVLNHSPHAEMNDRFGQVGAPPYGPRRRLGGTTEAPPVAAPPVWRGRKALRSREAPPPSPGRRSRRRTGSAAGCRRGRRRCARPRAASSSVRPRAPRPLARPRHSFIHDVAALRMASRNRDSSSTGAVLFRRSRVAPADPAPPPPAARPADDSKTWHRAPPERNVSGRDRIAILNVVTPRYIVPMIDMAAVRPHPRPGGGGVGGRRGSGPSASGLARRALLPCAGVRAGRQFRERDRAPPESRCAHHARNARAQSYARAHAMTTQVSTLAGEMLFNPIAIPHRRHRDRRP